MVEHNNLIKFEYSKITNLIYIGTNMCCQNHFNKELLNKRIKADLSLEEKKLDNPFGVDYYLWLPTKDYNISTLKQLFIGINFLTELEKQKVKCYVHCKNGHGRAPSLIAAFLISKGMGINEAVEFIKNKRNVIHLNKKHINGLIKFKKIINKMNNKKYYVCNECGLSYLDKKFAKKCEDWCKKHNSCNLNIIKHSVKK